MSTEYLLVANDNYLSLRTLTNPITGLPVEDAVVTVRVQDSAGVAVVGVDWPLMLAHAGDGTYHVLAEGMQLVHGKTYTVIYDAEASGLTGKWTVARTATNRSV